MVCTDKFEKLPVHTKPFHYKIHLKPDLVTFECKGKVDIGIDFTEPVNSVKLHSACTELYKVNLILENGKEWPKLKFNLDKKWKVVQVEFPQALEPQRATLSIEFMTEINKNLRGFYRSSYKAKDGSLKYLASTQFESDSARYAFPSFDEPIFKAVFDVELEVDENLTALSNTNVISESPTSPGKRLVKFATTPIMSTYLVAFIVGELEYIETTYDNGIPIRLYALPGKQNQGKFSLEVAKRAMEWYNDWFDYKSPLPKVDLVAIPDFSMGAMENWGLVTFREIRLLVTEESTYRMKSLCALVVAHELGHFWFGNLTTMQWWCDLWLKEGFASFMENLFVEKNYPEMKTALDFVSDVMAPAFGLDSLKSSHPIEVEINDPNELTSIYDAITYEKSNSIIRMLYYYLGEETFREGLRLYIKRFAYKNAVTENLWTALSDVSKQDINKLMSCWTKQIGFPLIQVDEEKLPGKKRRLLLKQTRYLADGTSDDTILWQVPITIINASNTTDPVKLLMTEREQEVVLDNIDDNDWVKLNAATSGFYRVQYSESMLKQLMGAIHSGKLDVLDRFGLVSDLYALVKSNKAPASQFLALVAALVQEDEFLIWQCVEKGLRSIINVLERNNPELKEQLDRFICTIMEPVASRLGWDVAPNEDPHKSQLRALILNSLSKSNHSETIKTASDVFDKYLQKNDILHPDLRSMVFATASRNCPKAPELLLTIFKYSKSNEVQRSAIAASVQTKNVETLANILNYAVYENKVRPQDLYLLFYGLESSTTGQDFAYDWFKKNHDKLIELFGDTSESIYQHCFEAAISSQSTKEFVKDIESFYDTTFNEEDKKACKRVFEQSREAILLNAALYENHHQSIGDFLSGKQ